MRISEVAGSAAWQIFFPIIQMDFAFESPEVMLSNG